MPWNCSPWKNIYHGPAKYWTARITHQTKIIIQNYLGHIIESKLKHQKAIGESNKNVIIKLYRSVKWCRNLVATINWVPVVFHWASLIQQVCAKMTKRLGDIDAVWCIMGFVYSSKKMPTSFDATMQFYN